MINNKKLIAFAILTILFGLTLTLPNVNYTVLIIAYIGFILVGLYDLGNEMIEKEEEAKKNNKAE
jgi:hypothetical protein